MQKIPYLILALFFFIADQLSKWFVTEVMIRPILEKPDAQSLGLLEWLANAPAPMPFVSIEMLPFFNIVMVWNKGVSFGLFSQNTDYGPIMLSLLAVAIIIAFTIWLFRSNSKFDMIAIALVIGGAMGNIMDRVRFGAVIDFFDFHAFGWHYPAFNISDSCIVIGVFLLITRSFFFENTQKDAK